MKVNNILPFNHKTQQYFRLLPQKSITYTLNILNKIAFLLDKVNINPNFLSTISLIFGLGAGILFYLQRPLWAGMFIIICGAFDILDGKVATRKNKKSLFGAIIDSTLDRYSEFFIYMGLAAYYRNHWALWLVFAALFSSIIVSYTRARAEGLGVECKLGIMQRAERILFLSLGAIIGALCNFLDMALILVLGIIVVISNITAFQRIFFVGKIEKLVKSGKENTKNGKN